MKQLLLTTIAAVLVVGCGPSVDIHQAAKDGNIKAVKQHLAAGTDVNAQASISGRTPLHYAAWKGHKEIAELLIAKGADVNVKDEDGDTPLDYAITFKRTELADLLRKHGGKTKKELEAEESIHAAARYGSIEAVKQHLATGTDVNAKADDEWTPLHEAAWHGHKEIVELLIAKGANVNARNNDGFTPLDSAIQQKKTELADLIRKHGGKTGDELKAAGN